VANGIAFVGLTSNEEYAAGDPNYPCCSERGSIVAVDVTTHQPKWETFTVPLGYNGGNIWGSSPVVDLARNTIYVGTGNNYSLPAAYTTCINNGGTPATCLDPSDHVDSILALDGTTGAVKWATRLMTWNQYGVTNGSDFWNVACFTPPYSNCPPSAGPDYDFGSAPNEITYKGADGKSHTIIGAGQKSGIYYALDPDSGAVLWRTQVGPGSSLGGMEWGSASDGTRIYVAIANLYGIPYGPSCDFTTYAGCWTAGSWAALDPASGKILWQTPDPNGGMDLGPLAVDNGVVFAPSAATATATSTPATAPTMVALNASTGTLIWKFASGASSIAGASMVNGTIFWGTGYSRFAQLGLTGGNQFFAFTQFGH
jgi:polyvinyl alcohol dehydrogenase (cytochrome)